MLVNNNVLVGNHRIKFEVRVNYLNICLFILQRIKPIK